MSKQMKLYGLTLLALIALAACAPAAAPTQTPESMMAKTPETMMDKTPDAMMEKTPDAMMAKTPDAMMKGTPDAMMAATPNAMMSGETMTDTMMAATPDAMMPHDAMTDTMTAPAWFSAVLTEATTGATFTLQDYKGKVVLVETMAMWCPTCLQQQKEVKALHALLGKRDDFISVGIGVDINESLAALKDYVANNGFDWTYTVASQEVAREIGNLYGAQFLNPPSAPMLIIDRHGAAHPLPFGVKSTADLQKALEPFLNDAM